MDLQFKLERSPIGPFLGEAEREKLKGTFDAETQVKTRLGEPESLEASGTLSLEQAVVSHIAALEKAASFTGKAELNPLRITDGRAKYEWKGNKLAVRDLFLEAKGTLCLRGSFTIQEGEIDGTVQLGVAPEIVDKFPGARQDVFTREEGHYLWTPVKLTGPFARPRDDLKPRLMKAVENHTVGILLTPLKPLLKPAKAMTDVIESLFNF